MWIPVGPRDFLLVGPSFSELHSGCRRETMFSKCSYNLPVPFGYCRVRWDPFKFNTRYGMTYATRALPALVPIMALFTGRVVTPIDVG